jgi:SagB-type dehydrogenase family enzyme
VRTGPVEYHDATRHHFDRFARSLGYLDWAAQPNPFRRYDHAPLVELPRAAWVHGVSYSALYDGSVSPAPVDERTVGELLRCSLGLSAWKQFQSTRWALRVNPSSGNLHPTEAYIVWDGRVCHYAPRELALEVRCALEADPFAGRDGFLIALTSIFWREAWKYGERAFRYCQHDVGHALGAIRFAAALLGWRATLLPQWSDVQIGSLVGIDRDEDFDGAEREDPECMLAVTPGEIETWRAWHPAALVEAARRAAWHGTANRLSAGHVDWPIVDQVAVATRYPGVTTSHAAPRTSHPAPGTSHLAPRTSHHAPDSSHRAPRTLPVADARTVILQRRSAVAFDPKGRLSVDAFVDMLQRVRPDGSPWDVIDWSAHVHLALFVHRVDRLQPGVYLLARDASAVSALRESMRPEFLWEPIASDRIEGLYLLLPYDMTWPARRVSCDQDIAGDGFFSMAMLARFAASLTERGPWFYRRLFWECGLIGQVLYLAAEAAGARSTGIGCFYDEPVHEMLGLAGPDWQSLYHFSMGSPLEDGRLTTEPGYAQRF